MKKITVDEIRKLNPCYDTTKYVDENWQGTVLDIIDLKGPRPDDKIGLIRHFVSDKTNRLFAVWCAREALKLIDNPDPRSIAACDIAEKFAHGLASKEELDAASSAARSAADAAWRAEVVWSAQLEKFKSLIFEYE